jgi:alpha-N-acetylglucosamine transferase
MIPRQRLYIPAFIVIICFYFGFRSTYKAPVTQQSALPAWRRFNSSEGLPQSDYAIATFLTGWFGDAADDTYLNATRVMAYQFLHAESTRIESAQISFFVLCTSTVPLAFKQRLVQDGVTVVDIDDVPVNWWISTSVRRWKEQFTKLRLLQMTQYQRVLFIDADTMLMSRMDSVFEEPEVKSLAPVLLDRKAEVKSDEWGKADENGGLQLPKEWTFVAPSDNGWAGQRNHPVPHFQTVQFSAGFWVVRPDLKLFQHCLAVMSHWKRFDPYTMEQSLLNYVFRRQGPMPWRELHWRWSATWPSEKDVEGGVVTLHEKFWKAGPGSLQEKWKDLKDDMEKFHRDNGNIVGKNS